MKNQIKNDLNNIKNSGQIVINTAISNDNGSRQYRASDVIEKGKSTNFMKREEIFAVLGAVASGVTIVAVSYTHLDVYKRQSIYCIPSKSGTCSV